MSVQKTVTFDPNPRAVQPRRVRRGHERAARLQPAAVRRDCRDRQDVVPVKLLAPDTQLLRHPTTRRDITAIESARGRQVIVLPSVDHELKRHLSMQMGEHLDQVAKRERRTSDPRLAEAKALGREPRGGSANRTRTGRDLRDGRGTSRRDASVRAPVALARRPGPTPGSRAPRLRRASRPQSGEYAQTPRPVDRVCDGAAGVRASLTRVSDMASMRWRMRSAFLAAAWRGRRSGAQGGAPRRTARAHAR